MELKVNKMTPKEIRRAGLDALLKNLGVVGMIRFLQDMDIGHGDYTKERHKWLGAPDLNEIEAEIERTRK